jgi:hypothetical protein
VRTVNDLERHDASLLFSPCRVQANGRPNTVSRSLRPSLSGESGTLAANHRRS